MQLRPEQPHDEVVVVLVEAVACEPHVGRVPAGAVALRERAVLGEYSPLVIGRQRLELLRALQRVPHGPLMLGVQELRARLHEQRVLEVVLVADRVRPAQHVELGLVGVLGERPMVQQRAQARDEVRGIFRRDHEADALRIVRVEIQRADDAFFLERLDCRVRIGAAAERREFHEQSPVEQDLLAAAPALFRRARAAPDRRTRERTLACS